MFNKLNPLIADGGAENDVSLKEDFKKSVRVEKFRIGEKAVYVPAGFSWKYLLKKDIDKVIKGKWLIQSENGVAPWAQEAPARRGDPGTGEGKERAESAGTSGSRGVEKGRRGHTPVLEGSDP